MPKKINGAVELQNYVPKGNGDPSGEYAELLPRSVEMGEPISESEFDEFVKPIGPVDVAL